MDENREEQEKKERIREEEDEVVRKRRKRGRRRMKREEGLGEVFPSRSLPLPHALDRQHRKEDRKISSNRRRQCLQGSARGHMARAANQLPVI